MQQTKVNLTNIYSQRFCFLNSLTLSSVLRHSPQRCIGGSSLQHCNALQYIALYYNASCYTRRQKASRGIKGCFSGDANTHITRD